MHQKKFIVLLVAVVSVSAFLLPTPSFAALNYQLLEPIPGATNASAFPDYVRAIYKFGLWTVGLAALFMLTMGGFLYVTSAGNTSSLSKAKTIIWDSIIGLVLALLAYLILFVINSDLVNVNIASFNNAGGNIAPVTPATPVVVGKVTPTANETLGSAGTYVKHPGSAWYPDAAQSNAVTSLNAYNILINGVKGDSKLCTTEGQAPSCTSLYQIRADVVPTMEALASQCRTFNGGSWCTISITGGTEYWKHAANTKHMPGNPTIDIGKNSSGGVGGAFFKYVQSVTSGKASCQRGGKNVYSVPIATAFGQKYLYLWDEDDDHWHCNVNSDMCH